MVNSQTMCEEYCKVNKWRQQTNISDIKSIRYQDSTTNDRREELKWWLERRWKEGDRSYTYIHTYNTYTYIHLSNQTELCQRKYCLWPIENAIVKCSRTIFTFGNVDFAGCIHSSHNIVHKTILYTFGLLRTLFEILFVSSLKIYILENLLKLPPKCKTMVER